MIELDRASALLAAGKSQEAIAIASEIIASLAGKDAFATLAEALLLRGRAEAALGKHEAAETTFAEALTAAERGRANPLVAAIWVELVQTTGAPKHRFEAATANVRAAEAAFTRVEPGRALRARFTYVVGGMLLASGKFEEARASSIAGTSPTATRARASAASSTRRCATRTASSVTSPTRAPSARPQ